MEVEIVKNVKHLREEDPGIGAYKLFLILSLIMVGIKLPGRDKFYNIMRRNRLMLPPERTRHTTKSNHRYHKYKNLIKGMELISPNSLWVSDITYIETNEGVCYLHLVTDAYSHKIVGWCLSNSLKAIHSIEALQMAIEQCPKASLSNLIHHSDRGVQYCCDAYVNILNEHGIKISMCEDYKPTDNAIAERINGIIKEEKVYRIPRFENQEEADAVLSRFIEFYNARRPHSSIGFQTPNYVHENCAGELKRCWKNYYKNSYTRQGL